jgi:hypothetical protein
LEKVLLRALNQLSKRYFKKWRESIVEKLFLKHRIKYRLSLKIIRYFVFFFVVHYRKSSTYHMIFPMIKLLFFLIIIKKFCFYFKIKEKMSLLVKKKKNKLYLGSNRGSECKIQPKSKSFFDRFFLGCWHPPEVTSLMTVMVL